MEDKNVFDENLEEIRKISIIEVSHWWGLRHAGYSGTIITETKELYLYQYYHNIPKELESKNANFILKKKELSIDEFDKVINFIENEIVNKEFCNQRIFDAGFDVKVNYGETRKIIKNNRGTEDNWGIYDKAKHLMDELLK